MHAINLVRVFVLLVIYLLTYINYNYIIIINFKETIGILGENLDRSAYRYKRDR